MTQPIENSPFNEVLELLTTQGFDGLGQALQTLFNAAMRLEREHYLGAGHYERSGERTGHANGFKPKTVKTRLGALELAIPQTRDSQFYPQSLGKGIRSERALNVALAEMYIQGVSTRKVGKIVEDMCGFNVSSTEVSRIAAELDAVLQQWRERPLECCPYVYLDARYEKIRHGGHVIDMAVLIAMGVDKLGVRKVLGVSVDLSEAEVHWRQFLQSLSSRGLQGIELIISDAHSGLKAALKSVFPSVQWQRCQFHLQQNAQSYVPKQELKIEAARDIRNILNAPNKLEAERLLKMAATHWSKAAPKLSEWMESNVPESLTVFNFPENHRKKIRTSNVLERVNKEIKRRTRVAGIFPNEAACLRLVSALLMETSEGWEIGKRYLPE